MPKLLCVWADIAESDSWSEEKHVSAVASRLSARAYHFETIENSFKDPNELHGRYLTIYEIPETDKSQEVVKRSRPTADSSGDDLKQVRLDTRCYSEIKRWQDKSFENEYIDAGCVAAVVFTPFDKSGFFEWYETHFQTALMTSHTFLRTRFYELDHATILEGETFRQQREDEALTYLVIHEFTSEELPWATYVAIGQTEGWRKHVELGMHYQIAQYHLRNCYSEEGKRYASDKSDETPNDKK